MPATLSRKAAFAPVKLVALALLATPAALLAAAPVAAPDEPRAQPADKTSPRLLRLAAGSQRELVFDKGVERIAIADETVATVTVSRKTPTRSTPATTAAARLILTGKKPGQSTLMVWERGSAAATTYLVEVQRPMPLIQGSVPDMPAYRQAREEALAAYGDKAEPIDRAQVGVRSHTVQVEVRVVEFSRSVLKQAGLNLSSYGPNSHGFSFLSTSPGLLSEAFNLALNFGNANKGRGMQATLQLLQQNGLARVWRSRRW